MAEEVSSVAAAVAADPSLSAAHGQLLADRSIQFDLPTYHPPPPSPPPDWLRALLEAIGHAIGNTLSAITPVFPYIFYGGLALVVALLIYYLVRGIMGARWQFGRKPKPAEPSTAPDWRPDEAVAKVLLEDADRLAAEGRFAEAAHLLLHRSLNDVRAYRPRALRPAVTSRELAVSEALPGPARQAFSHIAEVVERSYFGGRAVDKAAYADCRRSYEAFAFPTVWA